MLSYTTAMQIAKSKLQETIGQKTLKQKGEKKEIKGELKWGIYRDLKDFMNQSYHAEAYLI